LERTTNGFGKVEDMLFDDLRKLNAGDNEKIPKLSELLEVMYFNQLKKNRKEDEERKLFIELKGPNCEKKVIEKISKMKMKNQINIISFNLDWLKKVRELDDDVEIGVLMARYKLNDNFFPPLLDLKISNIGLNYNSANQEFIHLCFQNNINVWVWNPKTNDGFFFLII
jgi:glycerophosphoryl diester phosphodiesterase